MLAPCTSGVTRLDMVALRDHVRAQCLPLPAPYSSYVLFFSSSNGRHRARVTIAKGQTFDDAWEKGLQALNQPGGNEIRWLRVDWPTGVERISWRRLGDLLHNTKRNYFRLGISLDQRFERAFLEQELNANAILYGGNRVDHAVLNVPNFRSYMADRFSQATTFDFSDTRSVFLFSSVGAFCDEYGVKPLHGFGLESGRRVVEALDEKQLHALISNASDFLARQVGSDGRFVYGYHPCFDRTIDTYNTLRHASSTYAMIEAFEVTRDDTLRRAIERALAVMAEHFIGHASLPDGPGAAFLREANDEIKLGGNAVALLALAKHARVFGTDQHRQLMQALAEGICFMMNDGHGPFRHVLSFPDLETRQQFRTIYYEGEAVFALMRLFDLTEDKRWLDVVERAFTHFIAHEYTRYHDHWLGYCANELTRHRPNEAYFRFAIDNVASHLDFVENRVTTFPTLLELMMATKDVLTRLDASADLHHLYSVIDLRHFERAMEKRANHLLNGHFWPEYAMFMKNPERIIGAFFIRHHAFRVRIDDVEHYLSGLIAYLRHLGQCEAFDAIIERHAPSSSKADHSEHGIQRSEALVTTNN